MTSSHLPRDEFDSPFSIDGGLNDVRLSQGKKCFIIHQHIPATIHLLFIIILFCQMLGRQILKFRSQDLPARLE